MKKIALTVWLCIAAFGGGFAQINVTNINDAGAGSLRDALTQINALPAGSTETIIFNIGAPNPTIALASALPAVANRSVIIQDNGAVVKIDGTNAGAAATGLSLTNAPNSQIRNLYIHSFKNGGLKIANSNNTVVEKMVVSGNKGNQAEISNCASTIIQNNCFGTDFAGTAAPTLSGVAPADLLSGLRLTSVNNSTVQNNVFSANEVNGLELIGSSGNTIIQNIIGSKKGLTAADLGTPNATALGNKKYGILFNGGSANNILGSATDITDGNIICYNGSNAGWAVEITDAASIQNLISHNYMFCNSNVGINNLAPVVPRPLISGATSCGINGIHAVPGSRIEVYQARGYCPTVSCDQGERFLLGNAIVQPNNTWSFSAAEASTITDVTAITALAFDANNNTSVFSACLDFCLVKAEIPDTAFCKGNPLTIDGVKQTLVNANAAGNLSFRWYSLDGGGETLIGSNSSITIAAAGNYRVKVTGCTPPCETQDDFSVTEISVPELLLKNANTGDAMLPYDQINLYCDEDLSIKAEAGVCNAPPCADFIAYQWYYRTNQNAYAPVPNNMGGNTDQVGVFGLTTAINNGYFKNGARPDTVKVEVTTGFNGQAQCTITQFLILEFDQKPAPVVSGGECLPSTLTASSPNLINPTYQWSGPNGFAQTGASIGPNLTAGTYTVTVTSEGGCTATTTKEVFETPALNNLINPNIIGCGLATQSTDPIETGVTYTWYSEDPATTANPTVIIAATDPAQQPVTIKATDLKNPTVANSETKGQVWVVASRGSCSSPALVSNVTIKDTAKLELGNDREICISQQTTLDAADPSRPGANDGYKWQVILAGQTTVTDLPETTPTLTLPNSVVNVPGKHKILVSVTHATTSCPSRDAVEVTLKPAPTLTLPADGSYCGPQEIEANTDCIDCTYFWEIVGGTQSSSAETFTLNETGTVRLTLTENIPNGCTNIAEVTMTISKLPEGGCILSKNETELFQPVAFSSDVTDPSINCKWEIFEGGNTTTPLFSNETCAFTQAFEKPGQYKVKLTLTDALGCEKKSECQLTVQDMPELYPNNVLTPYNADGANDVVKFDFDNSVFKSFEIKIFDRWGNMMYQSNDPTQTWDATNKGSKCAPGVYYYWLKVVNYKDATFTRSGTITLVP